jgi:hypothetical protein
MTRSYTFTDFLPGRMGQQNSCETQDESTRPDVFAKLLRRAFKQIAQDKLIETESHVAGASLLPLIRVSTSRAEGIMRRETLRVAPFARYYFHDAPEHIPDYTLRFDIQFDGGGRKELSVPTAIWGALAIAWGGVNTLCNPTSMVLDAVLSDRSGKEVRRFHIARMFSFSGELHTTGCCDDEVTNPDAVSELVRSLYAEMKADGTLANLSPRVDSAQ